MFAEGMSDRKCGDPLRLNVEPPRNTPLSPRSGVVAQHPTNSSRSEGFLLLVINVGILCCRLVGSLVATVRISRPEKEQVLIGAWGEGSDWICDRGERWVGLADHPEDFVPEHPLVSRLHRLNPGTRFGATGLVSDACGLQFLLKRSPGGKAVRSMRALIRKWGDSASGPPVGVVLLPAPEKLAAAAYYDLHPLGLERKRAETLLRAARWHGESSRLPIFLRRRPVGFYSDYPE